MSGVGVPDAVPEGLDRLARERAAGRIDDRPGDDERQALADLIEQGLDGEDGGLGIERIEDRLDEQDVRTALDEPGRRLTIGGLELLPRDAAGGGIAHVRAHRRGPVGRAKRTRDVAGAARLDPLGRIRRLASEVRGGDVEFANDRRLQQVVGLGDAGRGERVGGHDVRARFQVGPVDRLHGGGLGQAQQVDVASEVVRVVAEALAAEVGLAEPAFLEHRPHRPVEDDDPLAQQAGQGRQARRAVERRGHRVAGTGWAGCRTRIRRTSSAACSYRPKLGMM